MPVCNHKPLQYHCRSGHPRKLACLFLLCACLFLHATAHAAPYQAATVRSLYLDSASGQWTQRTEWLFQDDGAGNIAVGKPPGTEPLLVLGYDSAGLVIMITKRLQRGGRFIEIKEVVEGTIVLSAGFPVPYDQLGGGAADTADLQVKNSVGGVIFSAPVSREVSPLAAAEAQALGMLTPEAAGETVGQGLTLLSVMKAGRLEVRQLWRAGEPFWLYEETPTRKSWRTSLTTLSSDHTPNPQR